MEYFLLDGIDSRIYSTFVVNREGLSRHIVPSKTIKTERIAGLDGSIFAEQLYDRRDIPLYLLIEDNDLNTLRQFSTWLGKRGQRELILSYEPYKFHYVVLNDQVDMEDFLNGGYTNVNFTAINPYGFSVFTTQQIEETGFDYDEGFYYDSGLLYGEDMPAYTYGPITTTTTMQIYHGGNVDEAQPEITLNGSATSITLEHFSDAGLTNKIGELSYGSFSGELVISSRFRNCYLNGSINNTTFDGEYFDLLGKESPVAEAQGAVQASTSNTITLSGLASVVNDFYNGQTVVVYNGENVESFTVADYNGSSKTLTISGSFENTIDTGYSYVVYDPEDGMNYVRISGSGLNLSSIEWDFRYIYI